MAVTWKKIAYYTGLLTVEEQEVVARLTGGNIDGITIGIADDNMVQVDGTTNAPADDDYAKWTANGLEGRSASEVRTDINVEDGSTADQTGAEIKTAYEAEDDTNAFTDNDHSKLDGIEAGADQTDATNVAAAGALMSNTHRAKAYKSSIQADLPDSQIVRIDLDAVEYDPGSNFDVSSWLTGNADEDEENKLHDADGGFTKALVGVRVQNTDSLAYAYVTAFVDSGELTLNADIFPNGNEPYEFKHSKFTVPVSGYYQINANLAFLNVVAAKRVTLVVSKNPGNGEITDYDRILMCAYHTSSTDAIYGAMTGSPHLDAGDIVELRADQRCGVDTVDVFGSTGVGSAGALSFMDISLLQAD